MSSLLSIFFFKKEKDYDKLKIKKSRWRRKIRNAGKNARRKRHRKGKDFSCGLSTLVFALRISTCSWKRCGKEKTIGDAGEEKETKKGEWERRDNRISQIEARERERQKRKGRKRYQHRQCEFHLPRLPCALLLWSLWAKDIHFLLYK